MSSQPFIVLPCVDDNVILCIIKIKLQVRFKIKNEEIKRKLCDELNKSKSGLQIQGSANPNLDKHDVNRYFSLCAL